MTAPERHMLSFDVGAARFQMRAVAIIRREGNILMHRATHEQFWSLPGGRVEFGETAAEALEREMLEELGCSSQIGEFRMLVENMFVYEGRALHEIGWYFDVALAPEFPFILGDICHRSVEGAYDLEFRWVPADAAGFAEYPLMPPMLAGQLLDPRPGFRHIVERQ